MIDHSSPPGAYRAALAPDTHCAACHQAVCPCSDAAYQGLLPATPDRDLGASDREAAAVLSAAARRTARGYPPVSARPASVVVPLPHASEITS